MKASGSFHIWLIAPDSNYIMRLCHRLSLNPDHVVRRFTTVAQALAYRLPTAATPGALILDGDGPEGIPLRLVRKLRERLPTAHCYIVASQPTVEEKAELQSQGITNYLAKEPGSPEQLWQAMTQARHQPALPPPATAELRPDGQLLGQHASIRQVRELIAKAARTTITVSVTGETGTGKELVAQAIHAQSARAGQPFVAINMTAIPRELLESELFGHEKGSFTGAATRRIGRFEEANGGTLFLDEIADLELGLQAKLLRVLQERAVTRVGGSQAIPFDARLVVATHRDLAAEVQAGRFREDLYYRLLGMPIELPPLRSRGQDILLLAESFVQSFSLLNKLPLRSLSPAAREHLLSYDFPGNVRELKAMVELATVLADGEMLEPSDIPLRVPLGSLAGLPGATDQTALVFPSLREQTLAIMQSCLNAMQGDVVAASNRLRVGRSTLYRLIQSGHLHLPPGARG
ncbi:sigma-54-dependent transcriptional regulator [Hymenobacter sp. BRD67]|uniref:sigma-54-dependent transcriptional regulator n=1 Tax=Hymenobacter sp. BRD67 TaxID=2675877 RepID=UPI0020B87E95|nr:sigma-54 dependent transcriptional regulator [Hymenobacter sp. BRD67]